jgi:hypothetical protein
MPIMIFTNQDRSYARVACDRPEGKRSSQLPSLVTLSGAKGLAVAPDCHPERSEGSVAIGREILRCAQDDRAGFGR